MLQFVWGFVLVFGFVGVFLLLAVLQISFSVSRKQR